MSPARSAAAHHHRRARAAPLLLAASLTLLASPPPAPADEFDALFRSLRRAITYTGREGGLTGEITSLVCARFRATEAVIKEIDVAHAAKREDYVAALYAVLGTVADPASIPWLTKQLETDDRKFIYGAWLSCWQPHPMAPAAVWRHFSLKQLTGAGEWHAFFLQLLDRAPTPDTRLACLRILATTLDSPATTAHFRRIEPTSTGVEYLTVAAYLLSHGEPLDVQRLSARANDVAKSPDTHGDLLYHAWMPRHEALIPTYISLCTGRGGDAAETCLRNITFQDGVKGRKAWAAWWEAHRHETRADWRRAALDAVDRTLPDGLDAVLRRFRRDSSWTDPELAPYMQKWLRYKQLHPSIARWVARVYDERHRAALAPIAETVARESWDALDEAAQDDLTMLDLVPGKQTTWESRWCRK